MTSFGSKAMPRAAALLLSLALLAVSTAPLRAHAPDEIRIFLDRFTTAFDNLDWPAFIALFDDDATVFYPSPPNAPIRATGRAEFEPAWQRVFEGIRGAR